MLIFVVYKQTKIYNYETTKYTRKNSFNNCSTFRHRSFWRCFNYLIKFITMKNILTLLAVALAWFGILYTSFWLHS